MLGFRHQAPPKQTLVLEIKSKNEDSSYCRLQLSVNRSLLFAESLVILQVRWFFLSCYISKMQQILSACRLSIFFDLSCQLEICVDIHKFYFGLLFCLCFFLLFNFFHLIPNLLFVELNAIIFLLLIRKYKFIGIAIRSEMSDKPDKSLNYHNYSLLIIISNQMKQSTLSQQKMKRQIKEINDILIKYAYPGIINKSIHQRIDLIQEELSEYFQPTPKRQQLIQWLILQIYPPYHQEIDSKLNKKRKILNYLSRIGALPFSKHTKNLDYQKYLQGLLGYENAINLIYNLCILLKQMMQYSKCKQDGQFHSFLQDIIKNYDNLVNNDYDPYKVSFPSAFHELSQEEFDKQYNSTLININKLKEHQQRNPDPKAQDYSTIIQQFQENKEKFKQMYQLLIQKMKSSTKKHQNLIKSWQKVQINNSRTIKISNRLPKLYKQYKEKIKILPYASSQLKNEKEEIKKLIEALNETVSI